MAIIDKKASFEKMYRIEKDVKVKERMLLVLNVVYYGKIATHVAKETFIKVKVGLLSGLKGTNRMVYRRIKRQTKMWQTSKNIKTGRIQDKDYFEKQPEGWITNLLS